MTQGEILKTLIIFAIPYILSNILQNIYTLADTAIAGQLLGLNSFAAVGASGSVVSLCISTITGLMSGFSVVAGIRLGAKKISEIKNVFVNALTVVLLASFVVTIFGIFFSENILRLMNTPEDILEEATIYLQVIFAGISTTMLYNFFCEMLRAIGNSKFPLIFLIFASVLHIALNYLLILVFEMGVSGAGWSTVISQGISALLCFLYMYKKIPYFKITREDLIFKPKIIGECLKVGIPMASVNFVVSFGVLISQFVTNGIGTEYIAAYSGASKIGYIYTAPIFGFASALAVFASQNFGAGNFERIKRGIKMVIILLFALNTGILLFSIICSPIILSFIMERNQTAMNSANLYLTIRMLSAYALIPAACYKSILPALKRTLYPTVSGFVEVIIRFVAPVMLVNSFGFVGVPLTDTVSWVILAIFFIVVYPIEMRKVKREINCS